MQKAVVAERVAVICARTGEGDRARPIFHESAAVREVSGTAAPAAVVAHLEAAGIADAAWFAPRDADDVDAAVRRGEVSRVVFDTPETFLAAVWDRRIDCEAWQQREVLPEFAGLGEEAADGVRQAAVAWVAWARRRRRAQAAGGVVLSAVALAAASWVLWMGR